MMSETPKVSILMPVRNEEEYLQAALDSLTAQSLTEWELVAVDDGSVDRTRQILSEAAARDKRIRVLRCNGGGLVAALNEGLENCRAPLLARMDGDDISHPGRLSAQAGFMDKHPDTGLVACSFRHFPRTSLKQGMLDYETWQNSLQSNDMILRDIFVESPFVHPGIMTRTAIIKQLKGYRDCGWPEDYDLWLRMAAGGVRFARLTDRLFFWRDHPERATRTMSEYSLDSFRSCKLHHLRQSFLEGCNEVVMAGAGIEARAWQRLLSTDKIRVSHWLDVDPRKTGRTLHGAPVTQPEQLELSGRKMLVAIGVRGAREQFRKLAEIIGWQEGMDFVCVA